MLHNKFNHINTHQTNKILHQTTFTITIIKNTHTQQQQHIQNFKTLTLFNLNTTNTNPHLTTTQHNSNLLTQKIIQQTTIKTLQHQPKNKIHKIIIN